MSQRFRFFGLLTVAMAASLATALAGCGVTSTGPVTQVVTPSPAPTFGPTATPRPAATPTPFGQLSAPMFDSGNPPAATSGDMQFSAYHILAIDPPRQLPDNLALKPYAVNGGTPGYLDTFDIVNVHGYSFAICNISKTQAHAVRQITVKLDAFAVDTNAINTSRYCVHLYTRQGMVDHTGCGGGFGGGDKNLTASFAASGSAGTVVPTEDVDIGQPWAPVTLAPGYGAYFTIDITPPSTPGTVNYRIGFAFDGAASAYPAPASPPVINATATRMWDGDACLSNTMQQQMPPATTPPTYYICPQA